MKNKKKNVTIGKSGLVMTYDKKLDGMAKKIPTHAKYVELNKKVANLNLDI